MFDEILNMVKSHMSGDPQVSSAIPAGQEDAIHNEIATHVNNGLSNQAAAQGSGGLLSSLEGAITSGNPLVNAIEGGLVGSLTSKFGLPPAATGAIAAALPGLLQKFASKANDPNDQSITPASLSSSGTSGGGLSSLF